MQRVFYFRADTVSKLINALATDHSDQSKVLLRLLKIILKCRNPDDILSKLSLITQQVNENATPPQTEERKPEETNEDNVSETNLHTDHTVTVGELESAFESQISNTHRDEYSVSSIFYDYNHVMHNLK